MILRVLAGYIVALGGLTVIGGLIFGGDDDFQKVLLLWLAGCHAFAAAVGTIYLFVCLAFFAISGDWTWQPNW